MRPLPDAGGGDVGAPAQDGVQGGGRLGIVVLIGAGQRDHQAAGDVVRDPVHVVDLVGQQQFPDIGEHRIRNDGARRVGCGVGGRGNPAGVKPLDHGDQVDHLIPDMGVPFGV